MSMANIDLTRVRFLDETLREGDSRGYHEHTPLRRLELLRSIHEATGIRHFSLGFALVNASDRATLDLLLAQQRAGLLPRDLIVHVYGFFQTEQAAHDLMRGLDEQARDRISFELVCTPTHAIAEPQDGPWLAARRGIQSVADLSPAELLAGLAEEFAEMLSRFTGYGLRSVGMIAQDAFRCPFEDLAAYVEGAFARGVTEVRLHDSVGAATPSSVEKRLRDLSRRFPQAEIFGHFHDDFGMAVANSLTALESGGAGVDVTMNGVGNRAGNADCAAVFAALKVIYGLDVPGVRFEKLTELAREVERHYVLLRSLHAPITGRLLHLDESTMRTHLMHTVSPDTYLPYDPALVGSRLEAAHAPGSGRSAVELALERAEPELAGGGIPLDSALIERAFDWVTRERAWRATEFRERALDAMDQYVRLLRSSYVTDDDLLARVIATKGRLDEGDRADVRASASR
jgi:hydroxymethylglutaryl-coenzyme A lyase family protein